MDDRDIRDAFEELKRHDEEHSPRFRLPDADRPPRWRWRSGVITAAAIGMTAATLLILSTSTPTDSADPAPSGPVATNPFDQCSDAVSSELFAASDISWGSRTNFLLDIDTTLTDLEQ